MSTASHVTSYYRELMTGTPAFVNPTSNFFNVIFITVVIVNGIVPTRMACIYTGKAFVQRISNIIRFFVWAICQLYLQWNVFVISRTCSAILQRIASSPTRNGAISSTKLKEATKNIAKWKALRSRFIVFSVVCTLAVAYDLYVCISNLGSMQEPFLLDVTAATSYLGDFLILSAYVAIGYYRASDGEVLIVDDGGSTVVDRGNGLKSRWRLSIVTMSWIIALSIIPFGAAAISIYKEFGVELGLWCMVVGPLQFCVINLLLTIDWTRGEEIDSCSNYLRRQALFGVHVHEAMYANFNVRRETNANAIDDEAIKDSAKGCLIYVALPLFPPLLSLFWHTPRSKWFCRLSV